MPGRRRAARGARVRLQPGWPLFALFGGYPVWWVLGLGEFSCLLFAVPMAAYLVRQGPVLVPRGFGGWLLFVVWVVGGVLVLQVHAPGTISSQSGTRYFTFAYRLLWYVAATVALLYVGNTRRQISNHRVCLALSNMFVVVTGGGLLGMIAPRLQFRSGLEYLLPGALSNNGFVHGLIHPVTAQVQSFLGYDEARPSAPFAFTNEWGLAMACFLPFFLITWCRRDAGWRRYAAPVILLLATVSIVYSLNRGLWLALGASAIFVAVRYALMGRARMLALLVGGAVLAGAVVVLSPLGSLVLDRLAHPNSNQGRTNLGTLTLSSVLQGSPIMGFGSTRNVQGNFSSIAAAASAACPGCSPPPLGTQGHLWLVLFSQGLVGLGLYLAFFVSQLVRHLRLESPYAVAALAVIVVHLVTMPVYDSIGPALFAIMISVALLWRADADRDELLAAQRSRGTSVGLPSHDLLTTYLAPARRHAASLAVLALVGALAGGIYQSDRGTGSVAGESVLLPSQRSLSPAAPPVTLDTEAQLVTADPVLAAVTKVEPAGVTDAELVGRLSVSASPNTRILHLAFTAATAQQALLGVQAATSAFLSLRGQLEGFSGPSAEQGQIVQAAAVRGSRGGWTVSVVSGLMLGLCLGLVYWRRGGDQRVRLRRAKAVTSATGLPVLARLSARGDPGGWSGQDVLARKAVRSRLVASVVAVPGFPSAAKVAGMLDAGLDVPRPGGVRDAVIVVSTRTRVRELTLLHVAMSRCGQRVTGVVVVEE